MSLITAHPKRAQRGSSMIEVMIALFVLAIGLLGFAGLQTEGITMGRQAYMHSQASILAQDMIERIQANKPINGFDIRNQYNLSFGQAVTAAVDCSANLCTAGQMAAWDMSRWVASVVAALPAGQGQITTSPAGSGTYWTVTIRLRYQLAQNRLTREENSANATPPTTYTYTLSTDI